MTETIINAVVSNVLDIVIAIIGIIVAYYIIPAIKEHLVPWLKEKRIYNMVKTFVQAAEKMANSGQIKKCDKKATVVSLLEENGITADTTIESFIESVCEELDLITNTIYEEIVEEDE